MVTRSSRFLSSLMKSISTQPCSIVTLNNIRRPLWPNTHCRPPHGFLCLFSRSPHFRSKEKKNERVKIWNKHKIDHMARKKSWPVLELHYNLTVGELALSSNRTIDQVRDAFSLINQNKRKIFLRENDILESETVTRIASVLGYRTCFKLKKNAVARDDKDIYPEIPSDPAGLFPRPPIVTVMGHVDHGKTTILDNLRKTSVAAGEAGGITQSIGAFTVPLHTGQSVTFLDTPGHAIFTSMRERGAKVTDIVVLVVAADDGVMEQTIESINMAKMAEASIIVAINKCDKKEAQPDLVVDELMSYGIKCEEIGGDVQAVRISALKNLGLDKLLNCIVTQAELLELKADPEMQCQGMIIESRLEKGRGAMASVVVKQGTLKQGKILVAGTSLIRVRSIIDTSGQKVDKAGPGTPVDVMGWKSLPVAGQMVLEAENESQAKQAIKQRERELQVLKSEDILTEVEERRKEAREEYLHIRNQALRSSERKALSFRLAQQHNSDRDDIPELRFIVKADVDGSMEALMKVLNSYDCNDQCKLKLLHHGVGDLTLSEMELAEKFDAFIFLFNTDLNTEVQRSNIGEVPIFRHNVIYRFVHDLKDKIEDCLLPVEVQVVEGEANVDKTFSLKSSKVDIAGCSVQRGKLSLQNEFRVVRDGVIVYTGEVESFRQFNKNIREATKGMECGLLLKENENNFNVEVGDKIQCISSHLQRAKLEWRPPGF